jgi:hypothetical protein
MKDSFDYFITMSKEDECFLVELGFDSKKVFGLTLPTRNSYVRPLSIGIFSSCYPDYRKNEGWLLDFCKNNPDSSLVNFVFIGTGWGPFVSQLQELNCSFEWHNVSRELPFEYMFQQLKLGALDFYLYMGMDGGAMGTYDAYAMSVPLCVSDDGYHKAIPDTDYKFNNQNQFNEQLGQIIAKQKNRVLFFAQNNVNKYVSDLFNIWTGNGLSDVLNADDPQTNSVLNKRRENYFRLSFNRIKQWASSLVWRRIR